MLILKVTRQIGTEWDTVGQVNNNRYVDCTQWKIASGNLT